MKAIEMTYGEQFQITRLVSNAFNRFCKPNDLIHSERISKVTSV